MDSTIDGRALKRLLAPSNLPPGVSEKDFDEAVKEMARQAQRRCQIAESGPCPAPPQSSRLIDRIKKFFSRPSPH